MVRDSLENLKSNRIKLNEVSRDVVHNLTTMLTVSKQQQGLHKYTSSSYLTSFSFYHNCFTTIPSNSNHNTKEDVKQKVSKKG